MAISHIFNKIHQVMIGLLIYFRYLNRFLRKAITLNSPSSKPVFLGNYMLARDATVSHKFSPIK